MQLVRERVREKVGCADWDAFGALLATTSPGNDGAVAFHYDSPEITPAVPVKHAAVVPMRSSSCDIFPIVLSSRKAHRTLWIFSGGDRGFL